jgi:DNA-binding HxlR family transcriptional regulator
MYAPRSEADPRQFITALARIGRHADTAILRSLCAGPMRFNEITAEFTEIGADEVGEALRELDSGGFVVRRVEPGPPLRVVYELTPLGLELAPALRIVSEWARRRTENYA